MESVTDRLGKIIARHGKNDLFFRMHGEKTVAELKQLIRDVLDEVIPEVQGPVQDGKFLGAAHSDWNACRNAMLDKRKELGL